MKAAPTADTLGRMDDHLDDDELFADMVATVTFDLLARVGDDRTRRVEFLCEFLTLAQRAVERGQPN